MESRRGKVWRSEEVNPGVFLLEVSLDGGGGAAPAPGQFYMVDCFEETSREHVLRRPLGVHGVPSWMPSNASLQFLIEEVGAGTRSLCSMREGTSVGLLGPLGVPFEIGKGPALLVAGGMGIAPLFYAASAMDSMGVPYDMMAGFSSSSSAYAGLGNLRGGVDLWTDDGSEGRPGPVSAGLSAKLGQGRYATCLACGPEAMLSAVARECEGAGVSCQVSLVARMACGVGACRGCVREARDTGSICVCSEGPVFDSERVVFDGGAV